MTDRILDEDGRSIILTEDGHALAADDGAAHVDIPDSGAAATKTLQHHIADDLAVFFDSVNGFAKSASYTPEGYAARVINVLFDRDEMAELGMESSHIFLQAKTADVSAAKPGETIVIGGVTYKIKNPPRHSADGTSEIDLSID